MMGVIHTGLSNTDGWQLGSAQNNGTPGGNPNTKGRGGEESYAQATSQGTPITIAPPQLMPAAHTR